MVFASFSFIFLFLPCVLVLYYAWSGRAWRNIVLLLVSLFFYAWGEPVYAFLMIASILFNWALALQVHRCAKGSPGKKAWLVVAIVLNLLFISVFKYTDFIITNLNAILGLELALVNIRLPIGISFYTFMAISYMVDTYGGRIAPQRNPLYFGTYLTMFPHLIAGPIVRYEIIQREIVFRKENLADFASGVRRFSVGLGKKVLIANTMAAVTEKLFTIDPQNLGAIPAWFAVLAYTLQIYFDFSGYSDMAIGLARMFGFHFNENFNYPYTARSISDFWRRWHMSLSTFFRDYVYIPLGGNRVGGLRWVINLMIVWGLTGLWHGASWNFVLWGLYFGVLLGCEKLIWGRWLESAPAVFQHLYSIPLFTLGWVIFRVDEPGSMLQWFAALFGAYGAGHVIMLDILNVLHYWPWFIVAAIGSTPWMRNLAQRWDRSWYLGLTGDSMLLLIFVWSTVSLLMGSFNPFIYFRF